MRQILKLISFTLFASSAFTQSFEWVNTAGSTGADATELLCSDSLNNIYSYGYFSDSLSFSNSNQLLRSRGIDIFINKTDSNGNLIFTMVISGKAGEYPQAIKYDEAGFIYILGSLSDSVYVIKDSINQVFYNNSSYQGYNSAFLTKMDLNGNIIWSQFFESVFGLNARDLVIDDLTNIAVVGSYQDTIEFGQIDSFNLQSNNQSGFIAIFDSSGTLSNTVSLDGSYGININKIEFANGSYTLTGEFRVNVDADPSANTFNIQGKGGYDIFFCQYNRDLSIRWGKPLTSSQKIIVYSLNQKNDFYYLSGVFSDTSYFDPSNSSSYLISKGQWDSFISKYDKNGNLIWVKQFGDSLSEYSYSMDLSTFNDIYITGLYHGLLDFDPDTTSYLINSNNNSRDFYISKFDSNGVFRWARSIGGSSLDYSYDVLVLNNSLYLSGSFSNSVDFDFDTNQVVRNSFGDTDAYLLKLSLANITSLTEKNKRKTNNLNIFPNPSTDFIQIKGDLQNLESIEIYDINGKLTIQMSQLHMPTINISKLDNGLYVLRSIKKNGSTQNIKFIKTD